jgi:hypothetical protein
MGEDGMNTRTVKAKVGTAEITIEASAMPNQDGEIANFSGILNLEGVSKAIRELAGTLKTALDEAKPTKATLEFGLQVGVQPGQLIAIWVQGESKANLKVKLEWGN